jgi:N-acyl-D-amino-acid deacylase
VIVDGTGAPWFRGDVGIVGDVIEAVGDLSGAEAEKTVDAKGNVVAPGFVDMHTHSDLPLVANPEGHSKIRQGVTTELIGHCGASAAPLLTEEAREEAAQRLAGYGLEVTWRTLEDYMKLLATQGTSLNVGVVVGHGNVRQTAMGYADRAPTDDEMNRMKELIREAMEQGAFGISTGLIYPPSAYADTSELVELSSVMSDYNGIYFTHMRNEGEGLLDGVKEAIAIGRDADVGVQISHHKAVGKNAWGLVSESLQLIEEAREQGVEVTCDQYPYVATSTGLTSVIPNWAHEGGRDELLARLKDPEVRQKMREEMAEERANVSGWDKLVVSQVPSEKNQKYVGSSIAEIAEDKGKDPYETTFELLIEEELQVHQVHFCLSEEDVKTVMAHPTVMPGSDGSALATEGPLSKGKPHPRSYGTFARVLGKYVREEGTLRLEEAVRKMTSLPTRKLGLFDRGILRPGLKADITVFDPDTVRDRATFTEPHQYAAGIEHVFVNGCQVVDAGEHTGERPGRVLKRV